jgi:TonB family protein
MIYERAMILPILLLLASGAVQAADTRPFVFENGKPSQFSYQDGVLTLRGGAGWVRSRRVFNDFVLTADFRIMDGAADAGVGLRTLTVDGGWPQRGYRISLTRTPGTIEARKRIATVERAEPLPPPAIAEWHSLVVKAEGRRITVAIDGAIATVANVEDLVGSVLLDVRRGAAEFRNISITSLPTAIAALREDRSAPAGEFELPRVIKEVKPTYTRSAMERQVEGVVEMEVIILEDGRVGPVTITKLPDPDLEQSAVAAILQWRFAPAKRLGKPVAFYANVELTFTLH